MHHPVRPLTLSLQLILGTALLPSVAMADDEFHSAGLASLPTVRITALPLAEELALPVSRIEPDNLFERGASTLAEGLVALPGVNVDSFGGGVSRPVIRGQTSPRVKVLSDGASLFDASDVSPDHAVSADPLQSTGIEVLRGPAALLYGGAAAGGVVNVLDNKIPSVLPEDGLEGSVLLRGNSAADERVGAASITAKLGSEFAVHAEGSSREADDYQVADWDEKHVHGSFAEAKNGSVGASWVTDQGYIGLAYSYRDEAYGLPGHSHEYHGCHPHSSDLHCPSEDHDDHEHEEEHEEEAPPTVDLLSKRLDLRGEYQAPLPGVERIRFRASQTDYRHHELDEGEIATTFRNDGYEARLEVQHAPIGELSGVVGIQHADSRFSAKGVEAFLPVVDTVNTGLFLFETLPLAKDWRAEFGARREWLSHETVDDARKRPNFDDSADSLSGAVLWDLAPDLTASLQATRSERLPQAQELYARGVHLATNTYECGLIAHPLTCGGLANNRAIETETAQNIELGLAKREGALTYSVSAYRNSVDNYIFARTIDRFEDFRLFKYSQADATFRGFEAELGYEFSESLSATLFGDKVSAEFAGGGYVPRIPAARLGVRLNGQWAALGGELEYYRVADQNKTADFETATEGHDMLNLGVSYSLAEGSTRLFLRGSNLLDETVWNHSSYLASSVPLAGRSLSAGLRYSF